MGDCVESYTVVVLVSIPVVIRYPDRDKIKEIHSGSQFKV